MTTSAPHVMTGRMRHRAELQKKDSVPDGAGGWDTTWVRERSIWCWIRPTSGVQRLESMRRESQVSHEIFTRFAEDVTTEKRITYRGKAYNLEAVWSPDERQEFLQIVATEGVAT